MSNSSGLPPYDKVIRDITSYVFTFQVKDERVMQCARTALLDALGCAIETVSKSADCRRMIGPVIPGSRVPNGFKLPGTSYCLDPLKGAFDLGTLIRYLDHNDAIAGKDWGHPSDNIGALLPIMDWLCREEISGHVRSTGPPLTIRTLLEAVVKVYEIQGCMLLRNAFNEFGLDHIILVKLASASVVPWLFGMNEEQTMACISHVWMDTAPLRVYRSGLNTIPRKGWAAGDACMRAVEFALLVRSGQPGSPTVLTMPKWGFYASTWRGSGEFVLPMPYSDWVIRNVFYKVMPLEGHGIAPVEASVTQSDRMRKRGLRTPTRDIARIVIRTNAAAKMIIDKRGQLYNHADRDHCMQYVVAVTLLKGSVPEVADFDDDSPFATSRDVELLRSKIEVNDDDGLTADYLSLEKKSIPSGVTIYLTDGGILEEVLVEFPCGHVERPETMIRVQQKFKRNLSLLFSVAEATAIEEAVVSKERLPVSHFVDMLARPQEPAGSKL